MHSEMDVLGEEKSSVISGNLSLDYGASSITIDFNYLYRMKRAILTPQNTENRVDPENLVIYTASFNEDGYYQVQPGAKVYYDESGNLNVEFEEPVFARYLILHCHYNEMDEQGEPVKAFAQFVVTGTDSVEAYAVVSGRNEFYIYDDKGNRKSRYLMIDTHYYDEYTLYGDSDLMQTDGVYGYAYDKNGNMIAKGSEWTSAGEGFHLFKPEEVSDLDALVSSEKGFEYYEYEYDLKNRLRAVYKYNHSLMGMEKTASYLYDIDGYRIKKQNKAGQETHFVFDTSGKVLEEVSLETGNVISSVFLKSRHLARVTAEETLFYGTDHQGSTVIVTDQTGSMVWSGEATPFGDAVVRSSGDRSDLDLKYTGKDLDEDTGLYYFNARWYDANTGRFISEDPARDGANWYIYTTNNPLKYIDPTGLADITIGFSSSLASGTGGTGGFGIVIDTDTPLESGIYMMSGEARGGGIGMDATIGYYPGDVEGTTINLNGTIPVSPSGLGLSGEASFETNGDYSGGSIGLSWGFGATNSKTTVITPITLGKVIGLGQKIADGIEKLAQNVQEILDGKKTPDKIQEGVQNPVSMKKDDNPPPPNEPVVEKNKSDHDDDDDNQNQGGNRNSTENNSNGNSGEENSPSETGEDDEEKEE